MLYRQKQAIWALLMVVCGAVLSAMGANFPLGTYVYSGSVVDYRHELMNADSGLTVQAVATNGTILATSRVGNPALSDGSNFRLEVPVSTESSAKSAAIGDVVRLAVLSDYGVTNISISTLPVVAAANAVTNVTLVNATFSEFAYGDKTVQVSDDYLSGISYWMAHSGKSAYEASADWDGDGVSNYGEYLAGTNPFDASDRLYIRSFKPGPSANILKFEYAGGHLYALDSTRSLTNATWRAESFSVGSPDAVRQNRFSMPGSECDDDGIGEVEIYAAPTMSEPQMFYTIRPE